MEYTNYKTDSIWRLNMKKIIFILILSSAFFYKHSDHDSSLKKSWNLFLTERNF